MTEQRFKGVMTEKYRLIFEAHPHLEAQELELGRIYSELPGSNLRILEIGCGDGFTTNILLNARAERVIAIDNEPQMIAQLEQNLPNNRVEAICCDVLDYLNQNSGFDVIVTAMTLHNLNKDLRSEVHRKIYASLNVNGVFLELDKFYPKNESQTFVRERIATYIDNFSAKQEFKFLKDWVLHEMEDSWPERAQYEEDVLRELGEIGFQEISLTNRAKLEAILTAKKVSG